MLRKAVVVTSVAGVGVVVTALASSHAVRHVATRSDAQAETTAVAVLVGRESEEGPVAKKRWLLWMQSASPNPLPPASATDVYAQRGAGMAFRVNPPGTHAETGGIRGGKVYLQLIRAGASDIAAVDLRSRRVTYLPPKIDTAKWEWRPSVSGDWLLFGRIDYGTNTYETLLADLATRKVVVLDRVRGHAAYAAPGQVNGRFAVWTSCPANQCHVYRYDIRTKTTVSMPQIGSASHWQFGAAVTRAGVVYFGVDRNCGDARLVRFANGVAQTVFRLPAHHAFQYTYADDSGPQPTRLLFDQVACDRSALSDIYEVSDPTPRAAALAVR
jgi:hypothetical protein